ncbi:YkvA family protein [Janibacter sp. GXQ6167]|uniref:YkvA family protein n=1 Tax=Janibacter sp. GXQ6167 TaxID=3240791 RepID=UPI0035269771
MASATRNASQLYGAVRAASRPGSPGLWQRLRAVPRMVRAVRSGAYTGVSSARLAMMMAGVAYVVSPIDLMPEGLLFIVGLADDALVLSWLAVALVNETEDFLAWEKGMAPASSGTWPGGGESKPGDPAWQTVRSHVVREDG